VIPRIIGKERQHKFFGRLQDQQRVGLRVR
jgi:hypothetical protein